jgi:hypothetical protein
MVDLRIDPRMLFSYVGFGLTEDNKILIMLGDMTDDGVAVAKTAAIMGVEEAQKSASNLRAMIKAAKASRRE